MQNFTIKASESFITPGFALDVALVADTPFLRKSVLPGEWEVIPDHPGITFKDNQLLVESSIHNLNEVSLICTHHDSGTCVKRSFKIIHSERTGKLVHFIKRDNLYSGDNFNWNLWTYDEDGVSESITFSGFGDFGITALVRFNNIIVRKTAWGYDWHNDWSDQTNSFALKPDTDNYYIVYGDNQIYTALADVIEMSNPCIEYAVMDEAHIVKAYLSHEPLRDTIFDLYIDKVKQDNLTIQIQDKYLEFRNLPTIQPNQLIEIRANNTFSAHKVMLRGFLNSFYYRHDDMGVVFYNTQISLRLFAPTAKKVELLIYNQWNNSNPDYIFNLEHDENSGTHFILIDKITFENKFYLYRMTFDDIDKHGNYIEVSNFAIDPYAKSVSVNGKKGVLIDLTSPKPDNWDNDQKPPLINKEDAIIYEAHVRDFSILADSHIPNELRGKFLGAGISGLTYSDNGISVTTGIDSLVELGVTHIHLLPIFDFSSVDESGRDVTRQRNWGYDPQNYNVPEGSYAVDPYNPASRIIELRQMIQNFHQKGLRVVMDIVYNHMTETTNMDNIVPGYYFRTNNLGKYTNGSGCGNELATEKPMVTKFIIDSILHWLTNYKIDGFRLDLMELMDFNTMQTLVAKIGAIDPSILIYGEPWIGGDSPLVNRTSRGSQKGSEFAIFNDWFRDAIRGGNNPGHGFVNGGQHNPVNGYKVIEGLKGSTSELTSKPRESINYVDAHDNYTLWDHIEKSHNSKLEDGNYRKNLPDNLFDSFLVRQNMLALGIILTAQGIPFLQGGVELLRTKNGDHNSYRSPDEINAIYWQDKVRFKPVFDYVRGLIELRRVHPAFRMTDVPTINQHLSISYAHNNDTSGVIVSHFKNHANGDTWCDIVVIYNSTTIDDYEINDLLPPNPHGIWHIVVNHEKAGIETISEHTNGHVPKLKSHSMLVVHN
jgi:pullulanase